jgi:uncharacterized protein
MKKSYLFFFVHPAKFHLSRITINHLISQGHLVDVVIVGKDILEELVINEGWKYTKIFPNGRRVKWLHIWLSAGIFIGLTIVKLLKIIRKRRYDLFITDDCLTFVGRLVGVPSVFVTDDDLTAVPESWILMSSSNHILAPSMCNLGKYNDKKWNYYGYKSLFHLHPKRFTPDVSKIKNEFQKEDYFFIRTVSATSTHDVGKRGIDDNLLRKIINLLKSNGKIILNSERQLPVDLQQYVVDFCKNDVAHYVAHSKIFISDSTTMCAEACVLAVPSIEIDDWYSDFVQYSELNDKYSLLFGFGVEDIKGIANKIKELLAEKALKEKFQNKRDVMLREKIDPSSLLIWMINNYPESSRLLIEDRDFQMKFK